ncbi:MAG: CoB--CoM heterodisulfide reductase iron-sulfur subunit B family protein [Desulfobacteraceae bacterium]|nr:CoB--CoM heterodisulfide reductase iron-sulfur subunit B family protein [Desulfobacteraceae bacterium]
MRYSLFIGCQIPARLPQYETAARAVFRELGVEQEDIRQFNCCGYPMRNVDKKAFLLSSVKNLALSEQAGLDMMVLCNCCFGALKNAEHTMAEQGQMQDEIREKLGETGFSYEGKTRIRHYLSVLYHEIGIENLKKHLSQTYNELNLAVQYGCHALRPGNVTEFDDPVNPSIFDSLVGATGAASVDWTNKLECCGAPLTGINDKLSADLLTRKVKEAVKAEADFFCTSCPYCQIQFDTGQEMIAAENPGSKPLASIVFPQLLGLSMNIDPHALGLESNRLDITRIKSYLSKE